MSNIDPNTKLKSEGRLAFPEDEAKLPWLPMLLEAYHITDQGVAEGIRREEAQGRKLACHKGCAACCRSHKTIPVYPLELVGISWYAVEKLEGEVREKLKAQLRSHKQGEACPFLVDNLCSIHPMRPMACRQFNVFNKVCVEGEDAYYTRRQDVLTPIKKYTDEAFYTVLPFYDIKDKTQRKQAVKEGWLHRIAQVLQEVNWPSLAGKMDQAPKG